MIPEGTYQREPAPFRVPDSTASSGCDFFIVGIGASAGGLEALEVLFDAMPADSGMAFVVVQHLSPDFRSLMDELLGRHTRIPIRRVEDGMVVEPDAIYLIPPKKDMIISGGRLLLTDKDPAQALSLPIDIFFRSLAQEAGDHAIAVVLSGTGSDGSRGIRCIHETGGLVVVQTPESARFDGMPRSAIDTGVVDFELHPRQIPEALIRYARHPVVQVEAEPSTSASPADDGLFSILQMLREEYGIDFSHYKPNTVGRRIERRLMLNESLALKEYAARLRDDPQERNALYRDLLIGVTKFFRDEEAFSRLEQEVLPQLVARAPAESELRLWVAGCATGEEAYSLAIALHEQIEASGKQLTTKIFATDVHRDSLDIASAGSYSAASVAQVSVQRLGRYFVRHGDRFDVVPELRRMIVFAHHNVIRDAPFTRLDLVTCRNLLIYLQPGAQRKALSLFHFALRTGGVLFLGPSETPGDLSEEFEPIDGHWKIFRKRRDARIAPAGELRTPLMPPATARPATGGRLGASHAGTWDTNLLRAYDALLDEYMPPSLLLNDRRELVHCFRGAGRFLTPQDGRPTGSVLDQMERDLRVAVAGALQRAEKSHAPATFSRLRVQTSSGDEYVDLTIRPVADGETSRPFMLVSFVDCARPDLPATPTQQLDLDEVSRDRLRAVEQELTYTKENLQATIEELETSNEELQATNEELVAANEELQSTNEELHSVNEELYTVNAEYQRKISELTVLTDDMDHLLRSTDVGTIFLDRDLLIRKFTPKIAHAFQLLPQDVGRRIDGFAHNILHERLLDDVRGVLETGTPVEHDVQDRFGEWFLLRILPYRVQGRVEGVVLTLIGISRLKQTEQDLRRLSKVFMDGADPIIIEDLHGVILDLNREAEQAYGWPREELLGKSITTLVPLQYQQQSAALRNECRTVDSVRNVETVRRDRNGRESPILLTLSLLRGENDQPVAVASIAKDISVQKKAQDESREAADRRDQFLAMLSHELRNPLGAILTAGQLLNAAAADTATKARAAAVIEWQSRQMARLLDDLLDVARVTQGKIHLEKIVVDLKAIVSQTIEAVRPQVESQQHTFELEVVERPALVEGDSARLHQVLENLLTNAIKYTPRGGRISVSLRIEGSDVVLRVADTGVGIEPDMQEKIFDLFVQASQSLERSGSGMGIGLTLVRNIVQLHGGQIEVRSAGLGQGSEFTVRLPITDKAPTTPQATSLPPDTRLKVAIVEDNIDSRELLCSLLQLEGYQVRAAADGVQGYEMIREERPDVALVDIGLPNVNGYELAARIRRELPEHPIRLVALTGYGRESDRAAVFDAGFDDHLVKPVDPDELNRVLRKPR